MTAWHEGAIIGAHPLCVLADINIKVMNKNAL